MTMHFGRSVSTVALAAACLAAAAQDCAAREVRVGIGYSGHDLVIKKDDGPEQGASVTAEFLTDRIDALSLVGRPRAYVGGLVSLDGYTNFANAGLQWRVKYGRVYFDFGGGAAVHDGSISLPAPGPGLSAEENERRRRAREEGVEYGRRVLFHATIALGVRLTDHLAAEVAAQHWSNGHVHSPTNDGSDIASVRLAYRF